MCRKEKGHWVSMPNGGSHGFSGRSCESPTMITANEDNSDTNKSIQRGKKQLGDTMLYSYTLHFGVHTRFKHLLLITAVILLQEKMGSAPVLFGGCAGEHIKLTLVSFLEFCEEWSEEHSFVKCTSVNQQSQEHELILQLDQWIEFKKDASFIGRRHAQEQNQENVN